MVIRFLRPSRVVVSNVAAVSITWSYVSLKSFFFLSFSTVLIVSFTLSCCQSLSVCVRMFICNLQTVLRCCDCIHTSARAWLTVSIIIFVFYKLQPKLVSYIHSSLVEKSWRKKNRSDSSPPFFLSKGYPFQCPNIGQLSPSSLNTGISGWCPSVIFILFKHHTRTLAKSPLSYFGRSMFAQRWISWATLLDSLFVCTTKKNEYNK